MPPTLEDAIALAAFAHRGHTDKAGEAYVLHVLRVMLQQHEEKARMAAVLHDVVEDTAVTLDQLRQAGYSDEICQAIDCLTRRHDETYEDMIARIADNPLACQIKLADLDDNLDPRRQLPGDAQVRERMERYRRAKERLLAAR